MGANEEERGGGMWCLNAELLKEEAYKENIRKCINYEMQNVLFDENVCEWWEKMKGEIKKKKYSICKTKGFYEKE